MLKWEVITIDHTSVFQTVVSRLEFQFINKTFNLFTLNFYVDAQRTVMPAKPALLH